MSAPRCPGGGGGSASTDRPGDTRIASCCLGPAHAAGCQSWLTFLIFLTLPRMSPCPQTPKRPAHNHTGFTAPAPPDYHRSRSFILFFHSLRPHFTPGADEAGAHNRDWSTVRFLLLSSSSSFLWLGFHFVLLSAISTVHMFGRSASSSADTLKPARFRADATV